MAVSFEQIDHVAIITLNRPEARNAVNGDVTTGLEQALDRYEADDNLRAAILTARGNVFCAGADLKEIAAGNARALFTKKGGFAGLVKRQRKKPLIAAIRGSAVAGGTEIALACDLVVATEDSQFGLPEVKRSLVAGAGGVFRLPRAVGPAAAMEMILTGDAIPADRALQLGLINRVVADENLDRESLALANRIAGNAPLAVQMSLNIARRALTEDDESLWRRSGEAVRDIGKTEDFKEGPRAFIEKRAPVWKGR